jgi:PhnB protein
MTEGALIEQLDQALAAMLRNPRAPLGAASPELVGLLSIAAELRDLPRKDFKARLKNELEREIAMSTTAASESHDEPARPTIREGFRTVTPYLTVADTHREVEFITKAFGAEGQIYGLGSAGGFHAEYKIGDSMLMIGGGGEGSSWQGSPAPGALHLYVEDVDAVYERAIQAGATSLMAPTDQEYGDRDAAVSDVGGNHWYIGTHKGARHLPEDAHNLMPYLHPTGAPKMIEFLKQAFGAEEVFVHQAPDGTIPHAKMRIGGSIVEMGEAHAQWKPMPMTFMLYVEDCDAWYARAMKAEGAVSAGEPANAAYGGRTGAVKDSFGNMWYISGQIKETTA